MIQQQRPPLAPEHGVLAVRTSPDSPVDQPADSIEATLAALAGSTWHWLHLDYNRDATHDWLTNHAHVPETAAEAMLDEDTRPRCENHKEGTLFIGRGVNLAEGADPADMVSVRAWIDHDRLITVVMRRLRAAEDIAKDYDAEPEAFPTPAHLLARLIDRMVDRMDPIIDQLVDDFDEFQQRVIDEEPGITTADLAPMRLRALTLNRYLVPFRTATTELSRGPEQRIAPDVASDLRVAADRLTRYTEDLAALESRAVVTKDEIVSAHNERLNRRLYGLTVLTAIFLPLTVLTGALGVNLAGIPFSDNPNAFPIALIACGVIVVLELFLLKKLRWL
jgi:zinc transporter